MYRVLFTVILASLPLLAACSSQTPAGPNAIGATVTCHGSWLLLDWPDGLRILIWDDIYEGGHENHGESSTGDPVFWQSGSAQSADGRGYEYSVTSEDGIEADFFIDGIAYDLAGGTVFLIRTAGGRTQVQQLDRDLSDLSPNQADIETYSRRDPDIAAFMGSGECPER